MPCQPVGRGIGWVSLCLLWLGWAAPGRATDWPQFLGPNRDGHSSETGLLSELPETGPPIVWRRPVGLASPGSSWSTRREDCR